MADIDLNIESNASEVASDMNDLGNKTGKATGEMSGMSKAAKGLKTQMAALAAGFGASRLIEAAGDSFRDSAAAAMELSDAMTPLVALGDNVKNFKAVQGEVNTLRELFGASAAEVSELTFNIQSGGAALDKTTKEGIKQMSLLSNKVAGFDLGGISKAALKTFNIFGKEAGSVTEVFNKFVITASDADASINDLAGSLPEVLAAAKGVGSSFDEVLASIIALTPSAGSANVAMTQLRNLFVRLEKAQINGTIRSKEFNQQLKELSRLPVKEQLKAVGEEGFASFNALANSTEAFDGAITKLQGNTGNLVKEMKKFREESDAAFAVSQKLAQIEQQKQIAAASEEAVSVGAEFGQRADQFLSGLEATALFVGTGLTDLAALLAGGGLTETGRGLLGTAETLRSQREQAEIQANLSRMGAEDIRAERNNRNMALQLSKATQNNKARPGVNND